MKIVSLRPAPPVKHECPRCKRVIRWALLYCSTCAGRSNPQYRLELDKARIKR